MTSYRIQEGAVEIPDEFIDCSVNVFTLSLESASEFSVVITRDLYRPKETPQECAERLFNAMLAESPGAAVVRHFQESLRVGKAYGIELVVKIGNAPVVQRQVIVPLRPTTLIITGSARQAFSDQYNAWFTKIVSSLER